MPEPTSAVLFHQAATDEYRRAVARFGSQSRHVNKLDAFAHASEAIRERIHSGELEIPVEDAIHAALSAADTRDGSTADGILGKIARGEIGLTMWPDPLLDVVVTLGKGRRKAWRHVTAEDLRLMVDLRKQNTNAARRAERRFLRDVEAIYADLVTAGTVGAMVSASRERASA